MRPWGRTFRFLGEDFEIDSNAYSKECLTELGERQGQGLAWVNGQRHAEMEAHARKARKRPIGRGRELKR